MKAPSADVRTVQRRILYGVANLAGREIASRLLGLVGGIVLARLLTPYIFGLFAIATFFVGLFSLFSELGLGAAFIRRREEVNRSDLDAFFTFQLALVGGLAIAVILAAPLVANLYGLPNLGLVVQVLAVSLIVISTRSAPTVATERKLSYGPIALSDILGRSTYWIVALALAIAGFGIWSLVAAILSSSVVSTITLYVRTRWRPRLRFRLQPIAGNLRFGLMYQGQSFASFAKDTMIPAFGGLVFGGVAVGYLSWAFQLSAAPLALTHLVGRVGYSALARLQSNPQGFADTTRAVLQWTARITFPAFAVLAGLTPQIVTYIYGPKWSPAIPSLYFLCLNMWLGVATGVLLPVIYSSGRGGSGLRISIVWVVLTYLAAITLSVMGVGFVALAIATTLASAVALLLMLIAGRELGLPDVSRVLVAPSITMAATGAALYLAAPHVVHGWRSLLMVALLGGVLGIGLNAWKDRQVVFALARSSVSHWIDSDRGQRA
jgi:O-antigen/teichoic acid export membrane protein